MRRTHSSRTLLIAALAVVTLGLAPVAGAQASPSEPVATPADTSTSGAEPVIEALHDQFLAVMRDAEEIGFEGRYERLRGILDDSFDLQFMAEKSVGRHWKQLSAEEQGRWVSAFGDMTTATYAGRFGGYSGQQFEILGEDEAGHDTVMIRARVLDPGNEDVQLNYRLHERDGAWRVIDVYLNGTVSELALRRSEYSTVLKRDGFEKLIETIDDKTQEIANASIN
jgi:phospholipid transport system substrate-binding protein